MTLPLISIVLPVYNGAEYLQQAIVSCLCQTHDNLELIVVDDCSTDDSLIIARECASRDARVKVLSHAENRKLPAALNTGFSEVRGDFLTWTSHDNLYAESTIEVLLSALKDNPSAGLAYSDFYTIDGVGEVDGEVRLKEPDQLIFENVVGASFLYRREVHDVIGPYDEDLFLAEDYDYWLRARREFGFIHLKEKLYFYRNHSGSLTRSKLERVFPAFEKALFKYMQDTNKEVKYKINYNMMRMAYTYNNHKKSIYYFMEAFRCYPSRTLYKILISPRDLKRIIISFFM